MQHQCVVAAAAGHTEVPDSGDVVFTAARLVPSSRWATGFNLLLPFLLCCVGGGSSTTAALQRLRGT
jgi:hypothetical protein